MATASHKQQPKKQRLDDVDESICSTMHAFWNVINVGEIVLDFSNLSHENYPFLVINII